MKVFHVFAVTLDEYAENEPPHVRYHDYYVAADSLPKAFCATLPEQICLDASEVWCCAVDRRGPLIVTPHTRLNTRTTLEQHAHWSRVQDSYVKAPSVGRTPLQSLVDVRLAVT